MDICPPKNQDFGKKWSSCIVLSYKQKGFLFKPYHVQCILLPIFTYYYHWKSFLTCFLSVNVYKPKYCCSKTKANVRPWLRLSEKRHWNPNVCLWWNSLVLGGLGSNLNMRNIGGLDQVFYPRSGWSCQDQVDQLVSYVHYDTLLRNYYIVITLLLRIITNSLLHIISNSLLHLYCALLHYYYVYYIIITSLLRHYYIITSLLPVVFFIIVLLLSYYYIVTMYYYSLIITYYYKFIITYYYVFIHIITSLLRHYYTIMQGAQFM